MLISTGDASKRMFHLKRSHLKFDVELMEIKRQTDDCEVTHYVYICTKALGAEKAAENWDNEKKVIYEEEGFDSDFEDTFSKKNYETIPVEEESL